MINRPSGVQPDSLFLRAKDANQILFAVLPLEYGMLVSGIDVLYLVVGDILEAKYLQLSSCFCATIPWNFSLFL